MALQHAEQSRQVQVRSIVQVQSPTVRCNNSRNSDRLAKGNRTVEPALSMEYSVDESTLIGDKSVSTFDSTLLGQNFDGGESKSMISPAMEPVAAKVQIKTVLSDVPEKSYHTHKSSVTVASSASTYNEQIPSDEELFAAGWAKTLDSSSGCYYYFTLDRKKTCWDNPLAPPESDDETSVGDN